MKRYITCQITSEGYVAIWWYDDVQNKIVCDKCLVSEGVEDRGYVQYSKVANHITLCRVVFDIKTQCYEIILSSDTALDKKVIKMIAAECNLLDKQVMVIPDQA